MRLFRFGAGVALALIGAAVVATKWSDWELRRARAEIDQLKHERESLLSYAERLSQSRRLAQITVLDQKVTDAGATLTRIRWQEIADDRTLGEPLEVELSGEQVYVEAMVVKFEHQLVGSGDELRGASLALFRRVFGDLQTPESGMEIGRAAPPKTAASQAVRFEQEARLWDRFWNLVDDPHEARQYGVRIAQCEAPSVRVKAGQLWEVSVDAAGGVNLKRLDGP